MFVFASVFGFVFVLKWCCIYGFCLSCQKIYIY